MSSAPAAIMSSHPHHSHHSHHPPMPHAPHQYNQQAYNPAQQQQQTHLQQSQYQYAQAYNQPIQPHMPPPMREAFQGHPNTSSGATTPPAGAEPSTSSLNNNDVVNVSPSKDDEEEPSNHITVLREHDVLLGRGGGTNNHMGNIAFRKLVQQHKMRYLACSKVEKPKVARHVVALWRAQSPPGRFLARVDGDEEDDTPVPPPSSSSSESVKPAVWYEVGDKKANAKASQCLRERTPEVMPYLRQLREQQDQHTEQGLHQFRQHQAAQQAAQNGGVDTLSPTPGDRANAGFVPQPHMSPSGPQQQPQHPQMVGSANAGYASQQQQAGGMGMYHTQMSNPFASPTHQREMMSMAAMQQQQQQHMASLHQSPGMMPSPLGVPSQQHGGMSHHISPTGNSHEAFQVSPGLDMQPQSLQQQPNNNGIPMAPQLHDMGPPHPMAPGSSAGGMPSNMNGMPTDEFGSGIAVEDMTDLEYEQSMMIMQQQLQMQQMQLKRMQQQRAMQRAALQRQQAHFDTMSPVKTTTAKVGGAGMMPPPMAGSSAEHPVEISQELSSSQDSESPPPPPPPPIASPRGLTRHAGLAPGASTTHNKPAAEDNDDDNDKEQDDGIEDKEPKAQEQQQASKESADTNKVDADEKNDKNEDDSDDKDAASPPRKKSAAASSSIVSPKPIRSALKRSDSPKGPPAAALKVNKASDSAPRKPPKRSLSGTQRPSVPDRTASGFMSIGSNDPSHPAYSANAGAELTLEEYRQQLEDYIASHAQLHVDDNAAGHGVAKRDDDNDADSDLEDDWEQEKTKSAARRAVPNRSPSRKGVDRHKSNTSMMSLDTRGSGISIFSNLSDLSNGLSNNNAAANNNQKKSAPGRSVSNQSHLSMMSELTDLSQNMDELSIREES